MKSFISTLSCIFITIAASAQSNIDVLHYKYEIELNDNNDTIYGKAAITVKFTAPSLCVEFDLVQVGQNKKGMMVMNITGPNVNGGKSDLVAQKYRINLSGPAKKNDTAIYTISYKGIPADGMIISKNKYGNRTFFSDNWPNRAHNWIPCVDEPGDKATVEFIVTAPSHYQVISNGIQVEETNLPGNKKMTHYIEDVPLPTKVMVVGAADFAVQTVGEVNCVPVYSWVYPENKTEGFYDYAIGKDILAYHINYIGPYPYKKLANVQSKTRFGGMENAGAIFYDESRLNGLRQEEELLSHEIVHQWFGDMATEKSFAHVWLSEGFATYLTHVYIESKYGTDSLNEEMDIDRETVLDFVKTNPRPVVDSNSNYMQLLNPNSYQKGSWILHMLRRQLGDSVFRKSIRLYYATYAGKNAETQDLQKIFETVSGKDLTQFFKQWLHTTVNPSLKISWKYLAKEKKIKLDVEQLQPGITFNLPLEIGITMGGGKKIVMPFTNNSRIQSFTWPVAAKPLSIIPDPNSSLLFEGTITEIK